MIVEIAMRAMTSGHEVEPEVLSDCELKLQSIYELLIEHQHELSDEFEELALQVCSGMQNAILSLSLAPPNWSAFEVNLLGTKLQLHYLKAALLRLDQVA